MLRVYTCLVQDHDLKLLGLAALICVLSCFASISLLRHAKRAPGRMRFTWLGVSAVATGFGIWATHFVGMLAYAPDLPSGYHAGRTFVSLVCAILLTGAGLSLSLLPGRVYGSLLGGAVIALGIATMHYLGMSAFLISGSMSWDLAYVSASIVGGTLLSSLAMCAAARGRDRRSWVGAVLLLTAAICVLHFTAMAAVTIVPDPAIAIPAATISDGWLALAIAAATLVILALCLAAIVFDIRDSRRSALEVTRLRELANASIEGLLISDGERIIHCNTSLVQLTGRELRQLLGQPLDTCFPDCEGGRNLLNRPNEAFETELLDAEGAIQPVELIVRPVSFSGGVRHVIAIRDLRARKRAEQQIHFLAHHDPLTGLPNRLTFNARMDELIATTGPGGFAVLCLDLDRFKEVNDLLGHAVGDAVLRSVADCVTDALASGQMMARLGGDEFAVLAPGVATAEDAAALARVIVDAMRRKSDDGETRPISTSIGIAIFPDHGIDGETLLSHADTALYSAKADGRDGYRLYDEAMGAEARAKRSLENDLRLAAEQNQFRLHYQPQQGVNGEGVTGFEALIRWKHPLRGEVSPAIFIPIAEESGTILEIGNWVLREACREAATWERPLRIAVNVSAVQLYEPDFVKGVHAVLLETGLSPRRLEIEITETALVRDLNRALAALRQVKALGVGIAMDDFGTGYSSLSNLRAFPFDKIKIDGSFVRSVNSNEQAAAIVRAVLGLGRGLRLPVLAEGVETAAELDFLRNEACDEVQGYYFGRPGPIENFQHLVREEGASGVQDALAEAV